MHIEVTAPPDPDCDAVALLALYGPRNGYKGAALLSLPAAQRLIGDLQDRVDVVHARRLGACAEALLSA